MARSAWHDQPESRWYDPVGPDEGAYELPTAVRMVADKPPAHVRGCLSPIGAFSYQQQKFGICLTSHNYSRASNVRPLEIYVYNYHGTRI